MNHNPITGRHLWEIEVVTRRGLDDRVANLFVTTATHDLVDAAQRFRKFLKSKPGEQYAGSKVLHMKHLGTLDA